MPILFIICIALAHSGRYRNLRESADQLPEPKYLFQRRKIHGAAGIHAYNLMHLLVPAIRIATQAGHVIIRNYRILIRFSEQQT